METEYFLNVKTRANGEHEVHKENCFYYPIKKHRISLGAFEDCKDALKKAKKRKENSQRNLIVP